MSKPVLAALLALILVTPARGGPAPDARALLQRTSDAYRALTSYDFEGVLTIHVSGAGPEQSVQVPVVVAADRAGRVHVDIRNPQMGGLLVSDGKQISTYAYARDQYVQRPAPPVTGVTSMPPPPASPLTRYFDLTQGFASATIVGEEAVTVGGRPSPCWVVRCETTPSPALSADTSARSVVTLWVDQARTLVLRDSTSIRLHNPTTGAPISMSQVTSYVVARVDEPLPDSLFVFHPPAGAKPVPAIQAQAGGDTASGLEGKPAPPFTLTGVKGSTISLAAYKGKVVLLDFWATWCRPCRIEMPRVEALYREFKPKGLVVFAVNFAEDPATVRSFLAKNPSTLPVLLDAKGEVGQRYQVQGIPTLVVIGRDGKVSSYYAGVLDDAVLRDALAKAGMK